MARIYRSANLRELTAKKIALDERLDARIDKAVKRLAQLKALKQIIVAQSSLVQELLISTALPIMGHRQTKADRRNLTNSSLPILIRAVRVIEAKVTRSESRLVN